jgi:hypothetical protein
MAQAVSRRHLTAEFRVRSRVGPCGICDGFYSTAAPLLGNTKKLIVFLVIFITGLHNKPQGCGVSVLSAAGPFTTKENSVSDKGNID